MVDTDSTLRIAFVGDVFLGSQSPFLCDEVCDLFTTCDAVIANLEGPVCLPSPCNRDKVLLHSQPGTVHLLRSWGVTHATLANNHMFDHGIEGFQATINELKQAEIGWCGAGQNIQEASLPIVFGKSGIRISLVAATEARTQATLASESSAGCADMYQPGLSAHIDRLKASHDHVIVSPHWGYCDYPYPDAVSVPLGEAILDAGATAVIGHHSHVPQGYRHHQSGGLVAYSLGNFYFADYKYQGRIVRPDSDELLGTIMILELDSISIRKVEWIFTLQHGSSIVLDDRGQRMDLLKTRSRPMETLEGYPDFWRTQVRQRFTRRLGYWLMPSNWSRIRPASLKAIGIMWHEFMLRKMG